ncbi:MAG: N-6 DNA methylase [Rhodoferax sp.]|nr:N-6 DNA methylase [Rhodoferax sp.]
MSQILINDYLRQLDLIKKTSGSQRETIVREAFKDLLKSWGKQQDLVFLAEYPLKTASKTNINVDGALLHELRLPLGYWEAKDADDDLDAEVSKKFKKGYPQDNIIFSDDSTAVLWQNRAEVLRCDMTDTQALERLLKLFFSFERPEIAGFRAAVAQFKTDLPEVLLALRQMIEAAHLANVGFRKAEEKFLTHAQEAINPALTEADVREMLIQHILTEEIFAKVFDDSDFHQHNNVARELYALEGAFFTGALKKQTLKGLETYYAAIRATAAQISSHSEKQTFLKLIYQNFYKVYNARAADRLGVVYTPNEIVRFMIDATDWLCEQHFGKNLIDRDVDILDPATGTGTFICELLEHFRGQPTKLRHKYRHELHANEIAILPYYVANLNIESTFAAITGQYEDFANLCFVDTLDNVGLHTAAKGVNAELFGGVSEENVARIRRQNSRRISVIIGNPPYYANQTNENDNNKSRDYPQMDARIRQTYIAESTAQKTKLYDMYARFFRWASDRLADNGILAFVSNRSFIESRTFDGFRKTVMAEFADIYVLDLGGDVRANPRLSGSRHSVFGIQTGVAISFMVKRTPPPAAVGRVGKPRSRKAVIKKPALLHYYRRPEMETAEEKLSFLASAHLRNLQFEQIKPDHDGNWLNQTDNDFATLLPLANKESKAAKTAASECAIFKLYSLGISTNRDEWVTDADKAVLEKKVKYMSDRLNTDTKDNAIKWSRNLKRRVLQGKLELFDKMRIRPMYRRPFLVEWFYDSGILVDERGAAPDVFPADADVPYLAIHCISSNNALCTLAHTQPPDLNLLKRGNGGTYYFPLTVGPSRTERADNITDWALAQFTAHYQAAASAPGKRGRITDKAKIITKMAIFHYCYAVLHDPVYLEKYAQNLKREFPRIPLHGVSMDDFWQWATWGVLLMTLHIGYEQVRPYPLSRVDAPDTRARAAGLPPKALLRADIGSGSIALDSETTLRGIPPEAWDYKLGNRSAIDWVLDQYKEKKPKDPTIREKFDSYRFADYKERVIDLLLRVTTVSIETMKLVKAIQRAGR